jgi:actin-related protein 8
MRLGESQERCFLIGHEALNLHHSEPYKVRFPMRFGQLNVSKRDNYDLHSCIDDLRRIIEKSIETYMHLPIKNLKHFSCILVIPDTCVKVHWKYIAKMLFEMGFKQMFVHLESIMATYALAVPSGVVVDIGSSKTSVCCVEEGVVIQKSVIKKHFGGDDQTSLVSRLCILKSGKTMIDAESGLSHLNEEYPYHRLVVEQNKERLSTMVMS